MFLTFEFALFCREWKRMGSGGPKGEKNGGQRISFAPRQLHTVSGCEGNELKDEEAANQ